MANDRYFKTPEDELLYEQIKRAKMASIQGDVAKREGIKTQVKRKKKNKALIKITALVASTVIFVGGIAPSMASKMQDVALINSTIAEFQKEVINEATYRTDDNTGYYYDYDQIAEEISNSDDIQRDMYCAYVNIIGDNLADPEHQLDEITKRVELDGNDRFEDFTDYLESRGYENGFDDIDDYRKEEQARILKRLKQKEELEKIMEDEQLESSSKKDEGVKNL